MNSIYCYHCMTYHPPEAMQKIISGGRARWRCIRSIEASRRPVSERDAFGQQQSLHNLAQSQSLRTQAFRITGSRKQLPSGMTSSN